MGSYILKTDQELVNILVEFGDGVTEFHTRDIQRLLIENERLRKNIAVNNRTNY